MRVRVRPHLRIHPLGPRHIYSFTFAQPLVAQQTPHSSLIKRSLLSTIIKLCVFFGRKETENFLLPLLFTFLNDTDWQLRAALFDHIAGVLAFAPWTSKSHKQILLVMLTDCEVGGRACVPIRNNFAVPGARAFLPKMRSSSCGPD